MKSLNKNPVIIFNACLAFFFYGGWAIHVNSDHGLATGLMAGSIQGLIALISTLVLTLVAQRVYDTIGRGRKGVTFGFCASFSIMGLVPSGLHALAETPNIITTILPGLVLGAIYILCYLIIAERKNKAVTPFSETVTDPI